MACPYCYNPDIVLGKGTISTQEALAFLKTRQNLLDGIVLSGGECTLYPDLAKFCTQIKALGYKIKIDTNGSNPKLLSQLIEQKLVDYIALDYKAPLVHYPSFVAYPHTKNIEESLSLLLLNSIDFEVRTTWHTDLLSIEDINEIITHLVQKGYTKTYYLQRYLHVEKTLKSTKQEHTKLDLTRLSLALPIELRNF